MRELELARVAVPDVAGFRAASLPGRIPGGTVLAVRSDRDVVALLLEAAEDLCIQPVSEGVALVAASDVAPFVLPRLAELLDPENDELRFVLAREGNENVSEHTIKQQLARGTWPTNGSATLEAAALAVLFAAAARLAAERGESLLLRWL